jgi:GTPase SAR1 family protein
MSLSQRPLVKVAIVGHAKTGKTALRNRLAGRGFSKKYSPTIGWEFDSFDIGNIRLRITEQGLDYQAEPLAPELLQTSDIVLITLNLWDSQQDMEKQLAYWKNLLKQHRSAARPIVVLRSDRYHSISVFPDALIDPIVTHFVGQGNEAVVAYSAETNDNFEAFQSALASNAAQVIKARSAVKKSRAPELAFQSDHFLLWGIFKWVVVPAIVATILFFSGGLAAIPIVGGAVASLGVPAALAITTTAVSLVGNFFRKLFGACCNCFSGSNPEQPASPRPGSGSTALMHSKNIEVQAQSKDELLEEIDRTLAEFKGSDVPRALTPRGLKLFNEEKSHSSTARQPAAATLPSPRS